MYKIVIFNIFFCFFTNSAFAQFDSIRNQYQTQFDQFKIDIEHQHTYFKNKNDSIFNHFIKDSWEEFDVFYNEIQKAPKPVIPPIAKEVKKLLQKEIIPLSTDSSKLFSTLQQKSGDNLEKKSMKLSEKSGKARLIFNFYGKKTTATHPGKLPQLKTINTENIESYFKESCDLLSVSELIQELWQIKNELALNDWGYYQLVNYTSRFAETSALKQTLFSWVVLLKSGYNVKVGFTDSNVYIMLPIQEQIYSTHYITIDSIPYYIQTMHSGNDPLLRLKVHKANYPENTNLSVQLNKIPMLETKPIEKEIPFKGDTIRINLNKWLADFYEEYPRCEIGIYFAAPLSENIIKSLELNFNSHFKRKTQLEKVAFLLYFVQTAFAYKSDIEQFGYEKYFFPDELFYFSYSDCEDRSILFFRLVKQFTDCDCIGLDFPGHINTAVHFNEEINGSFINFNNKKYMICDPTYINAPIGYLDSKYEKFQPKIIIPEMK